ncbi:toxin glutamine deamidase domain-containing protein [Actinokineospora fastidiosa]|nr:toxin glutamine deamidase domain-containing protein [Actinokineospora fastidiosa]
MPPHEPPRQGYNPGQPHPGQPPVQQQPGQPSAQPQQPGQAPAQSQPGQPSVQPQAGQAPVQPQAGQPSVQPQPGQPSAQPTAPPSRPEQSTPVDRDIATPSRLADALRQGDARPSTPPPAGTPRPADTPWQDTRPRPTAPDATNPKPPADQPADPTQRPDTDQDQRTDNQPGGSSDNQSAQRTDDQQVQPSDPSAQRPTDEPDQRQDEEPDQSPSDIQADQRPDNQPDQTPGTDSDPTAGTDPGRDSESETDERPGDRPDQTRDADQRADTEPEQRSDEPADEPDRRDDVEPDQRADDDRDQTPDTDPDRAADGPGQRQDDPEQRQDAEADQPTGDPDQRRDAEADQRPDESFLKDPDYRTDDPENFRQMRDTLLNSVVRENGELRYDQIRREALNARDANPDFAHMSDLGAVAVRTYTHNEGFAELNRALRTGEDLDQQLGYAKTLVSGLNELPPHVGPTVRFMGVGEGPDGARMLADQFPVGKVYVEPGFMSSSKVTASQQKALTDSAPVELRLTTRTGRDIEGLSSKPHEREVLSKPRTQLLVTSKELVTTPDTVNPDGSVTKGQSKWVIHAEEITPDHPQWLSPNEVDQRIEDQRAQTRAAEDARGNYLADALDPLGLHKDKAVESTQDTPVHQQPELYKPDDGWGSLDRPTDTLPTPALHHDTVATEESDGSPQRQRRLLDEIAPQLEGVNPKFFESDPAYRSNDTESLLAYENRMAHDSQAAADPRPDGHPMHDPAVQRDTLRNQLGGEWTGHNSLADAVDSARDLPVGSRTALSVEHVDPGPPPSQKHSMLLALSTEHGVALIDPASNRLATVPNQTSSVQSLPYHTGDGPVHPDSRAARAESGPSAIEQALGGPARSDDPRPPAQAPSASIGDRLGGKEDPTGYAGAAEPGGHHAPDSPGQSTARFDEQSPGRHDWSPLAQATNPPSEPAIHAGTANPEQDARYIAERHPELAGVNPHYHDQDARENGYQTNCTNSVVAHMQRMAGIDATADPIPPDRLHELGTLDRVQDALGGRFEQHSDYDSVIRTMRDTPPGSHAVVAVQYTDPSGETRGHVAIVTNTEHGVAFVDPQTGGLMTLPHPPQRLDLLPVDLSQVAERADTGTQAAQTPSTTPDQRTPDQKTPDQGTPDRNTGDTRSDPADRHGSAPQQDRTPGYGSAPDTPQTGSDRSRPESVDAAMQAAAQTRTDTGEVDTEAAAALINSLPSLPDGSEASIRALAGSVFSGDVTLEPIGGRDGRVRTERPVYRVLVDGEPVGVVKIVPDSAEFAAELSSAERLTNADLTGFTVPDVMAVASVPGQDGDRRGVLFSSLAPGESVDTMLRRVPLSWDRDGAMSDLRDAVTGVARGMAELHRGDDRTASPDYLAPHADAIREHLDRLEARRPILDRLGIDVDAIRTAMNDTLDAAAADPGPASLAHGDAHLGNFLWDPTEGTSVIDAPTMHQSMDSTGAPTGSSARDVALFDQRIGHFGHEFGLSRSEINQLRTAFAETYANNGGPTTPPHVRAMFDARAALHRLVRSVERFENRPEPRRQPDIGAAASALEDALGLDTTTADEVANGFAGELPGTPEFRRSWVAIDNFRSYMERTASPEVRERFQAEFADRIASLQSEQTAEFKKLWKGLFRSKSDEYSLTPEGAAMAEGVIDGFTEESNRLLRDLAAFANSTGVPELAEGRAEGTIDREGTEAWRESFREVQATIDRVLEDFDYRGNKIGYIGSMQTGWRGAHKGKTRFDPNDFDVDLYVVVDRETFDELARQNPTLDIDDDKIMPDGRRPRDIARLGIRIGEALKDAFPHVNGIEDSVIAIRAVEPW